MMKFNRVISRTGRGIVYLPLTIYINFKVLPFTKAVKLPIIVMSNCSFHGCTKKTVTINGLIKTGMIRIGAQKTSKRGIHVLGRTRLIIDNDGSITFLGNASIGAGTSICAHGGKVTLGNDFSCNINCFLYSMEYITTGSNVLLGWNINIRDNDGHPIYQDRKVLNHNKGITIGDNSWIASYVDLLKGVSLAEGTIVGTRSLVTKSTVDRNCLIAGVPARVIKEHISWDHEFEEL